MTFRFHAVLLAAFTLFLSSCASSRQAVGATLPPLAEATPTFTPFAAQPLPANVATLPVAPTFTPYPTQYVRGDEFFPPTQILPPVDSAALTVINPLTGLPVSDPLLLERRPMAIKVTNAPDYVRPQSGLTLADAVFEYYIEWGDTRFIAVMYSADSPKVGPVRSGRYFDEHVARMYNAFLVFKFADPREFSYLKNSTLSDFLVVPGAGSCPPFEYGYHGRETYNNFFFNTLKWAKCAQKRGVDNARPNFRNGFFAEEAPSSPLLAQRAYFFYSKYSYSYWQYDADARKYVRYQEAHDMVKGKPEEYAPLMDAQTGLQVNADNVAVLFAPHTFANQFNAEDEVYNIELLGAGDAYVFRDGLVIPARWNRVDENQPLLMTTLLGEPIYMKPGRIFYEVLGVTSPYTQSGDEWRFTFQTP